MAGDCGRLVIVGASGHGKVVADAAAHAGFDVLGFLDRDPRKSGWAGRQVLGTEDDLADLLEEHGLERIWIVVAVGDNSTRSRLTQRLDSRPGELLYAPVVHPDATVAGDVEIGPGTVVMAGAVLNPGARVGAHCIVNTGALVDHDCVLDDFSTVSPGACLGGNVRVGKGAVVGLGASVIQGIRIGDHAVLGAGAVAVSDVPDRVVSVGVPARVVRERQEDEPYL